MASKAAKEIVSKLLEGDLAGMRAEVFETLNILAADKVTALECAAYGLDEAKIKKLTRPTSGPNWKSAGAPIDREEYPEIKGLEGPFKFKSGILYYDPKEGKYYNSKTDMYLDELPEEFYQDDEMEDNPSVEKGESEASKNGDCECEDPEDCECGGNGEEGEDESSEGEESSETEDEGQESSEGEGEEEPEDGKKKKDISEAKKPSKKPVKKDRHEIEIDDAIAKHGEMVGKPNLRRAKEGERGRGLDVELENGMKVKVWVTDAEELEEQTLTEGKRIVKRVNAKGVVKKKVKCGPGFKNDGGRCVPIRGKEKLKMRKSQIKRVKTLKRKGPGAQRRAAIKRKRAMTKRASKGL